MNHRISKKKLNRTSAHRQAMLSNMACSLIVHGKIQTTLPKAKALRPFIEKLVTKARVHSLGNYRLLLSRLKNKPAVDKLYNQVSQQYIERPGGYTRILKCGFRRGDDAPMGLIQFI